MTVQPRIVRGEGLFLAPISRPAEGSIGKTGTWRTTRPVVDLEKCTGCYVCWLYCPENTIVKTGDGKVAIDYDYCKGCGVCAEVCPFKAIRMVEEG